MSEQLVDFKPRYNIAPTQFVPVVVNQPERKLEFFRWGLIPSWAKDARMGNRMINARAETACEKASFRDAYRLRRCLVPASGFYEWKKEKTGKVPFFVRLKSKQLFAFAGLWETWKPKDEKTLHTFTIITTSANELVSEIHDRMPVILHPGDYGTWLDTPPTDAMKLQVLLRPYPASDMEAFPISTLVNTLSNDSPEVILPAGFCEK